MIEKPAIEPSRNKEADFSIITLVFKIATAAQWQEATQRGAFMGSLDDIRDGFIHLSAGHQVRETLTKHFHGQRDLVLIALPVVSLAPDLKWEVSRGGDKFPHLYVPLETRHALWMKPLTLNSEGIPLPPEDLA
ncbi:MAG: DUF952 domain-containing protein [Hyphomicrobium sp.]